MSLRKEVKLGNDELHEIPVEPTRYITVDLNKSFQDYIEELCTLRAQFGSEFMKMCALADERVTNAEIRAEAAKVERTEENLAIRAAQSEPLDRFAHAWRNRNHDISELSTFLKSENTETLQTLLNQLEGNPQHYNSIFDRQIGSVIILLRQTLALRPAEKPEEAAVNYWMKVKKIFGMP